MAENFFEILRHFFEHYGYLTIAIALLLENAGLPVPGETVLLYASFLAYSDHSLHLPWIILIGIVACTLGDNLGYTIGKRGGRPLLERYQRFFRIPAGTIAKGERLFARYGAATILFARFVFGLRVIAGPMAGVLQMPWKHFAIFNLLGAIIWVTTISCVGYFVGTEWTRLLKVMKHINTGLLIVGGLVVIVMWVRKRVKEAVESR